MFTFVWSNFSTKSIHGSVSLELECNILNSKLSSFNLFIDLNLLLGNGLEIGGDVGGVNVAVN
jgi:hypothetical protein